jgi:DNA polymerase III subunit delta
MNRLLYILCGENAYTLEEELREIKRGLGHDSLLSSNTTVLEGQKITVNDIKAVGEAMPFLAEKRLVIIKGLIQRFEPKKGSGNNAKGKKNNKAKAAEDYKLFAECISNLPASTVLVLYDNLVLKDNPVTRNPLCSALAEKAEVKTFPLLAGAKLNQWIIEKVGSRGCGISQQALKILSEYSGNDLFSISNEIDKLVSYTGGGKIEEEHVRTVVSAAQADNIFALMDAVMDKKVSDAERMLEELLQGGAAAPQILVLLARQLKMLIQVKELNAQRKSQRDIQCGIGVFSPYAYKKILSRSTKYSFDDLRNMYRSLLETDLSIKTGKMESDLAMNTLIADLSIKR